MDSFLLPARANNVGSVTSSPVDPDFGYEIVNAESTMIDLELDDRCTYYLRSKCDEEHDENKNLLSSTANSHGANDSGYVSLADISASVVNNSHNGNSVPYTPLPKKKLIPCLDQKLIWGESKYNASLQRRARSLQQQFDNEMDYNDDEERCENIPPTANKTGRIRTIDDVSMDLDEDAGSLQMNKKMKSTITEY